MSRVRERFTGRIAGVGSAPSGWTPNRTLDALGMIVAPGLVDVAARLREPGLEHKATLESEIDAAAAGAEYDEASRSTPADAKGREERQRKMQVEG